MSKVMIFAGDSITQNGEYIDYISEAYPASLLLNKGFNGYKVADLAAQWQSLCLDYEPDVVTILVGVNEVIDTMRGFPNVDKVFYSAYKDIIEQTRHATRADIILMEPFIMAYPKKLFNWMLVAKRFVNAVDRLAEEYDTGLVKLWDIFNQADASVMTVDGIHITAEGHRLIADAWLEEYKRIMAVKGVD